MSRILIVEDEKKIARINQLAAKSKTAEGLTPEEKQEQVIARVLQMDLRTQAQEIVGEVVRRAEAGFEAVMADTGQA